AAGALRPRRCDDERNKNRRRLAARRQQVGGRHGDSADKLIVSARVSGDRHDPDGIGLFLVDATAHGVARRSYRMRDGTAAADIALSGVEVAAGDMLGEPGRGLATIERVNQAGIMATSAEAVG